MSCSIVFGKQDGRPVASLLAISALMIGLSLMAMAPVPALAADHVPLTYYVSPGGNDDNDGLSESRPLKDLASAMYRMGLGDTLIVLPGEYEIVNFRAWCKDPWKNKMYLGKEGGSADTRTTIKGKTGADRPKIRALNETGGVGGIQFNGAVGITLEHLDIHGGVGYGRHMIYRDCVIGGEGVVYGVSAEHHDSLIEDNIFHDIRGGSDAIGIYIHGHNNVIRRNFFKNMGQHAINSNATGSGSAYGPSTGWTIERNVITQTDGHGIGLQNVEDFIIRNNVLVNVGSQAISFGGSKYPDRNVRVYNNTMYNYRNKGYAGLFFINDVEGLVVENNLIVHSRPVTFLHPKTQLVPTKLAAYSFRNNLYYNPSGDANRIFFQGDAVTGVGIEQWRTYTADIAGGSGLEAGSVHADPQVVSPPASASDYLLADGTSHIDLRLSAGSPAIDAGIPQAGLSEDADGHARLQGAAYDIGAYEFSAGTVPAGPGVPENLEVTGTTETTVSLKWTTPSGGCVAYGLYREGMLVAKPSGTSFTDQGLTAGTAYMYQVSAFDGQGRESALSASVSATTALPRLPSPPTGLTVSEATTTTVTLRWTAPSGGCVAYGLYRNGALVAKPTATTFTDQGLTAGTTYAYQISSMDAHGRESGLSAAVTAETSLPAPPSAPTDLKATQTTTTTVTLQWSAPSGGCVAYGVYRNGSLVAKSTTTTFTDRDLTASTAYAYQVTAFDGYGRESAPSSSVSATTATASTPTTGRTIYVSPDGNEANDGLSETSPLRDLASAIHGMGLGDTLIVLPGTYELTDFRAWCRDRFKGRMYLGPHGGDTVIRTTIRGKVDAPRPKIRALKKNGSIGQLHFNNATGLSFEHLEIVGGIGYGSHFVYRDCIFGGEGVGSAITAEHHQVLIENCRFQQGNGSAIHIHGHYNTIRNNWFEGDWSNAIMTSATGDGASKGWVIENNVVSAVKGNGFRLINTMDTDIHNNVLVNVGGNAICLEGGKFADQDISIRNNTIVNGPKRGGNGLFIVNDVNRLALANNIILHRRPVYFLNAAARLTAEKLGGYDFRHNLYHNPYYAGAPVFWRGMGFNDRLNLTQWRETTAGITGEAGLDAGSLQSDPGLVAPSVTGLEGVGADGVDARLSASSPAIDAGCIAAPATDIDGHERPQGPGVDIGAHEFVGEEAI